MARSRTDPTQAQAAAPSGQGQPSQQGQGQGQGSGALAGTVKAFSGVMSSITGTVKAATGAFSSVTDAIKPFVAALNPAMVRAFDSAMRDLSAVIGVALEPLMGAATQLAREFGSVLLPVMEQLAPMVQIVANMLSEHLGKMVGLAASQMTTLLPVLEFVVSALSALFEILQSIRPVMMAFQGAMAGLLTGFVKAIGGLFSGTGIVGIVKTALQHFTRIVLLAAGALMKFMGLDSALSGMINALEGPKKKDATGRAAMTGGRIIDVASIGRELAVAATQAGKGAGAKQKTQEDWLQDIVAQLKEGQQGQLDLTEALRTAIMEAAEWGAAQIEKALQAIKEKMDNILGEGTFDRAKEGAGVAASVAGYSSALGIAMKGYNWIKGD